MARLRLEALGRTVEPSGGKLGAVEPMGEAGDEVGGVGARPLQDLLSLKGGEP